MTSVEGSVNDIWDQFVQSVNDFANEAMGVLTDCWIAGIPNYCLVIGGAVLLIAAAYLVDRK